MTIAPAAARRGESSREDVAPEDISATSMPEKSAVAASSTTTATPRQSRVEPADRADAKKRISSTGKLALDQDRAHDRADLARGSDDGDAHRAESRAQSPSSPKAVCRRAHRVGHRSARTTHEMRIELVEIISMLMPALVQRLEHQRGDARAGLHARADERHPPDRRRHS